MPRACAAAAKSSPQQAKKKSMPALGLHFIEPELREGTRRDRTWRSKACAAQAGHRSTTCAASCMRTPIYRMASTRSRSWPKQPARAAIEYFGVADHSKSAALRRRPIGRGDRRAARGDRPPQQALRQELPHPQRHRIRHPADGSLDYPDDVLARFDFVVASVHGRFKLDRNTQTQRIIRAVGIPSPPSSAT